MTRYWIGDGSFYRARDSAIDALALDLAERWHGEARASS
jgi:hypothetical protein